MFKNYVAQLTLNKITHKRERQYFSVITVDRALPAAGPGKGVIRTQFNSCYLQQFLSNGFLVCHGANVKPFWNFGPHNFVGREIVFTFDVQ